jgi:hypothetical protein
MALPSPEEIQTMMDSESGGASTKTLPSPEEIQKMMDSESVTPESSSQDLLQGGLKGIAKSALDIFTAPADLLFRAGVGAENALSTDKLDPTGWYPSDWTNKFLDYISNGQGNQTAETATHVLGNLGTALAVPSQAKNLAENIPVLSKLAEGTGIGSSIADLFANALGSGAEGAAYGVLGNPKAENLGTQAAVGATIGASVPIIGSVFGKATDYLPGGANRVATKTAQNIAEELRGVVPDALTSDLSIAERSVAGAKALEATGQKAKDTASAAFENLPEGRHVILDNAIQNIKDFAEELTGPIVPGGRTAQLIGYLERLKPADSILETPASTIVSTSGSPMIAATSKLIEGGPATVPINQFQNILRDVGTLGRGASGPDAAIIANAKNELLNAGAVHLAPEAADALNAARTGWRNMLQTFESGGVGKVRDSLSEPDKGILALKNVLLGDPKQAAQVVSVMAPHEVANAQNLMISDLLKAQPVTWIKRIVGKLDNYKAVFGEDGTQRLVDMMSREGTIGKQLLTDNNGLKALFSKLALRSAIGGGIGEEIGGHKGGLAGAALGLASMAGGNSVGRVQELLMRAAAGEPKALEVLNAPASQVGAQVGKLTDLLQSTLQREHGDRAMTSTETPKVDKVKEAEAEIDADPYLRALYQTESSRNPNAQNLKSTAKGGFQFIDATAKAVGLKDPMDLAQSLDAVKKLTDENKTRFGDDPRLLYAAHFLGAPLLSKLLKNAPLSDTEAQHVEDFQNLALPHFLKNLGASA